jgi:hypothetical protein
MRGGAWHCAAGTRCSLPARYWTPEKNAFLWPVIKYKKICPQVQVSAQGPGPRGESTGPHAAPRTSFSSVEELQVGAKQRRPP